MSGDDTLFQTGLHGQCLNDVEVVDMHGHYGRCFQFNIPHEGPVDLLSEMDRIGIDRLIMSSFRALAGDSARGNRELLGVCEAYPERFAMYYVVNPHLDPSPNGDFTAFRDHALVKGLKLHCEIHAQPLSGDGYRWALGSSADHGLPLLVHTLPSRDLPALPKLLDAHPNAKFIFAHHFGPENLDQALPIIKGRPNAWVDTCISLLPTGTVERLVAELGEERVLFGSDMPYLNAGGQVGKVLLAKLSDATKKKILAENTKHLFGLEG